MKMVGYNKPDVRSNLTLAKHVFLILKRKIHYPKMLKSLKVVVPKASLWKRIKGHVYKSQ